jgi:hypothetical protein
MTGKVYAAWKHVQTFIARQHSLLTQHGCCSYHTKMNAPIVEIPEANGC